MSIKDRQKKEYKRLIKLFDGISSEKLKAVDGMIQRAAFMRVALEDLEDVVDKEGVLDLFEQGDYTYNREHPAMKSYNQTVKNYNATMKQIVESLPEDVKADELIDFIAGR